MFKKIAITTGMILFLAAPCFAGELEETRLKMKNIQLEFQWLSERQKVLQYEAKALSTALQVLEAKAKEATKVDPVIDK
jgi:hypothetical protein